MGDPADRDIGRGGTGTFVAWLLKRLDRRSMTITRQELDDALADSATIRTLQAKLDRDWERLENAEDSLNELQLNQLRTELFAHTSAPSTNANWRPASDTATWAATGRARALRGVQTGLPAPRNPEKDENPGGTPMNLPEGLPAWTYIIVAALAVVSNIATALWTDRKGRERDRATRGEITNNHPKPLRDDLDEKNRSVLDAIDNLRDDMNGEFATVNRRIANSEDNLTELRREVHDLRGRHQPPTTNQ